MPCSRSEPWWMRCVGGPQQRPPPVRSDGDYFLAMLDLALSLWPTLAAQPSPFGTNAEQYLTGQEIHDMREDTQVRMVGRRGGALGDLFAKDVASRAWKKHRYEVSSKEAELAGNPNWFTVEEFVNGVTGT